MSPATLSRILLDLHAAAHDAPPFAAREALLAALRPHLPFDSALWGAGTQTPPLTFSVSSLDCPLEWLARYPAWQEQDALRAALAERPEVALRNEDIGPIEAHWASAIHAGFCGPAGIERTLGIASIDPTTRVGELLCLFRRDRDRPFTDGEARLLEAAMPHLLLAARQRLIRDLALSTGLADSVTAIVDEAGHVHASDPGFGPAMRALFPDWTGPLLPARLGALVARGGGLKLQGRTIELARGSGRHLLAISDGGRAHLTAAEQRAARLFASGRTARAVAAELGLSERTVRNQLAAAYQKLGVSSRVELIRHFAQGPVGDARD
ncbi:MAG: LuxR C-terminal-related transcriptional regulator [Sphingomonadaceae bacterium]